MHFSLVDRVLAQGPDRIVTVKLVSAAEEYLQDHFATFPVLPGVLMLEAMVQAGRLLVDPSRSAGAAPVVLGRVRALKYGRFVTPGSTLRVEVALLSEHGGVYDLRGEATVLDPAGGEAATAASGRFTLRPVRLAGDAGAV